MPGTTRSSRAEKILEARKKALSEQAKKKNEKNLKDVMQVYDEHYAGDRLTSLEVSIVKLRLEKAKMREMMEEAQSRNDTIVKELKRMLAEERSKEAQMAMKIAALREKCRQTQESLEKGLLQKEMEHKQNIKDLEEELESKRRKEVEVDRFLRDKATLLKDVEEKRIVIKQLNEITDIQVEKARAEMQVFIDKANKDHQNTMNSFKELQGLYTELKERHDIFVEKRGRFPHLYKKKRRQKQANLMNKSRDGCDPELVTRGMARSPVLSQSSSKSFDFTSFNQSVGLPQLKPKTSPHGTPDSGFSLKNFIILPKYHEARDLKSPFGRDANAKSR